jgi:transposase
MPANEMARWFGERPPPRSVIVCAVRARGRWYINLPVEMPEAVQAANARVGIDLGLKTLATLSCSDKIPMPAFYRAHEAKLATSQRARKSKLVRAIHAKIRNRRKDFLHKVATELVRQIRVHRHSDVSPSKLVRTNIATTAIIRVELSSRIWTKSIARRTGF